MFYLYEYPCYQLLHSLPSIICLIPSAILIYNPGRIPPNCYSKHQVLQSTISIYRHYDSAISLCSRSLYTRIFSLFHFRHVDGTQAVCPRLITSRQMRLAEQLTLDFWVLLYICFDGHGSRPANRSEVQPRLPHLRLGSSRRPGWRKTILPMSRSASVVHECRQHHSRSLVLCVLRICHQAKYHSGDTLIPPIPPYLAQESLDVCLGERAAVRHWSRSLARPDSKFVMYQT